MILPVVLAVAVQGIALGSFLWALWVRCSRLEERVGFLESKSISLEQRVARVEQ